MVFRLEKFIDLDQQEELKRRAELARERARVKAQKEDQERTSRAISGVNHLDVPAELAFVFNKLEGNIGIYEMGISRTILVTYSSF